MPPCTQNLIGNTFGKLTVISRSEGKWNCTCSCGGSKSTLTSALLRGLVKSCGCLNSDVAKARQLEVNVGDRYGRLVVVSEAERVEAYKKHRRFNMLCDCGGTTTATLSALETGTTRSCGCYHRQSVSERFTTHGMTGTPTYASWWAMLQRVASVTHRNAKHYALRGITMDPRWQEFENFYTDMGERPEGLSLDREDNDGGYCKSNCRWATTLEQSHNKERKGSKKRGVRPATTAGKFIATIRIPLTEQTKYLGTFDTYEDAVASRLAAEKILWKGDKTP